jgi:hypothetical protein
MPIPLPPARPPLPDATPPARTFGVPVPPLDESHWQFVFQDDPPELEEE